LSRATSRDMRIHCTTCRTSCLEFWLKDSVSQTSNASLHYLLCETLTSAFAYLQGIVATPS